MLEIQNRIGLWAYHEYERRHSIFRKKPLSQKLELLYLSFLEWLFPRCWHKGCKEHGEPCILRGYSENEEDAIYWYCPEHAPRHGFCFSCGEFWGGTESFDFGPGYCSNCASEFEEEEYDDDWEYEL